MRLQPPTALGYMSTKPAAKMIPAMSDEELLAAWWVVLCKEGSGDEALVGGGGLLDVDNV